MGARTVDRHERATDVDGAVTDALEMQSDLEQRDQAAQITGHGLAARDHFDDATLCREVHLVDHVIGGDSQSTNSSAIIRQDGHWPISPLSSVSIDEPSLRTSKREASSDE
jgi:hypothetical protein